MISLVLHNDRTVPTSRHCGDLSSSLLFPPYFLFLFQKPGQFLCVCVCVSELLAVCKMSVGTLGCVGGLEGLLRSDWSSKGCCGCGWNRVGCSNLDNLQTRKPIGVKSYPL